MAYNLYNPSPAPKIKMATNVQSILNPRPVQTDVQRSPNPFEDNDYHQSKPSHRLQTMNPELLGRGPSNERRLSLKLFASHGDMSGHNQEAQSTHHSTSHSSTYKNSEVVFDLYASQPRVEGRSLGNKSDLFKGGDYAAYSVSPSASRKFDFGDTRDSAQLGQQDLKLNVLHSMSKYVMPPHAGSPCPTRMVL